MTDECDVLVIGLGPAGAAAATAAAKAGAQVVAVERRPASAGSAHCPEFVPLALGRSAGADSLVIQHITGTRSHGPDGSRTDRPLPGCVIERDAFDRALVDFARGAGARLRHASVLSELDVGAGVATLAGAGGTSRLRFKALVAADGHASAVGGLLGLAPLKTMYTLCSRVPLHAPHGTVDIWISPQFAGGYGWLVPAGAEAVIGVGMPVEAAPDALDGLHRQLQAGNIVGSELRARARGFVAVGGMRSKLTWRNVLFAGDAAGLAHPLTGTGIYPAVVSGEAAGRAAAEWSAGRRGAFPAYEAQMRADFGETIERALHRRAPLESLWQGRAGLPGPQGGWSVVSGLFEH